MQDRAITDWLAADHTALSRQLEKRPLTEAVLARLAWRDRRKWMVLGAAAAAGVGLAGWQLTALAPVHALALRLNDPNLTLLTGTLLIAATAAALSWALAGE